MQRSTTHAVIAIFVGMLDVLLATPAHAQYSADFQTNIISGITSNWSGDYNVGYTNSADVLLIQDGGVLSNGNGSIGPNTSSTNTVIVSGSGSVWDNGAGLVIGNGSGFNNMSVDNLLIITNGGAVYSVGGVVGDYYGANNTVLVTGTGSVWSNAGNLSVGGFVYSKNNSLIIADGGAVYNNDAAFARGQFSGQETALVTGSGSVWHTGTLLLGGASTLTITNGGVVNSSSSIDGGGENTVLVTGKGSMWNSGSMKIEGEFANSLIISDGGTVYSSDVLVRGGFSNDQLLVTGSGSVWDIQTALALEGPPSVSLTVSNGGTVIAGDVEALVATFIALSGGSLYVTNGSGTGSLQVNNGSLTFNSGTLATRATAINNGSVFTVGDGDGAATFIMEPGGSGFHSFADGLTISSNAVLKGVGTVIGSTTVNPGGQLSPSDAPGSITFSNSLTLAPGSTFAVELDGAGEGQYSRLVGFDTLSVSNSILSVALGYTPSAGDTFTIISNLSATAVLGTFVDPDGTALTEGAEFVVDGTTFQIDYTANADGQDVVLTALIPEPSSLLLASLAALLLCPLLKRRRA